MAMVEYITYKGKKYPYRVGYYAIKMTKQDTGKDLSQLDEEDFDMYETLLYYSLEQGHRIQDLEFNFKKEEMPFVLDENFVDFVNKVPAFFQGLEQRAPKKPTAQKKPTGQKKTK